MMSDPAILSIPEAAAELRISKRYAYELARTGRFPVPILMVGSVKRVSRRDLDAFLGEQVAS